MTGKAQFFPRVSLVVSLGLLSLVIGTPSQAKIDGSSTSEFERLIFTSPTKVKYSSQKFGLKLLIEFSKPIEGNITSATKKLGKFVKQAKMQDSGREVVVEFTGNHKFKIYRTKNSIYLDVGAAKAVTSSSEKLKKGKTIKESMAIPKVRVRAGQHKKYTRIVFEWPTAVRYSVTSSASKVDLTFNKYSELDLSTVKRKGSDQFANINYTKSNNNDLIVSIPNTAGTQFRHFLSGQKVVVDFLKGTKIRAKESSNEGLINEPKKKVKDKAGAENRGFIEKQLGLRGVEKNNTPSRPSINTQTSKTAEDSSEQQMPKKASASESNLSNQAQNNIAKVISDPGKTKNLKTDTSKKDTLKARLQDSPKQQKLEVLTKTNWSIKRSSRREQISISESKVSVRLLKKNDVDSLYFDWKEGVPAAVFVRAGKLWVVFGGKAQFDISGIQSNDMGIISDFRQLPMGDASVLVAKIAPGISPTVWRKGESWVVDLSPRVQRPDVDLKLVTQQTSPQGPRVFVLADGIGKFIETYDPIVGDRLFIVPLTPLSRGIETPRRFAQFEILKSAQGLVVRPLIDELEIRVMPDGVAITASEFKGLEVSKRQTKISPTESRRAQLDGLPRGLEPGRIFNLEAWTQGTKPNEFLEMKQAIQQQISQATSIARGGPRLSLAQFYFAKGLAAETMGLLRTISDSDEEMARRPDVIALRGASQFILGRFLDAEKELDNRVLNGFSEAELWRGASNAAQGKWAAAIEHFARAGEIPGDYPRNFSIQLSLLAAEAAIRAEDYRGAGVFLDAIAQGKPTIGEQARLNYLRGRVLYASADIATALSFWRRLTNGTDRWASVRAKRALIEHNLRENTITRPQAIERLERLRFAWRGDQLEFDLLRRLGELYIEEEDFTAGLTSLRQAVTFFPNNIFARSVSKKMTKSFSGIYTDGTSDAMTPLTALALYDQFRELTPVGRRGDKIIQRLADRLVEVDLLDRASVLLDRQVRFRLQGVQKAQVGSRLALIRLLDRQPNTALEALDESVAPGLDPKLALQRKRLRARSVFELGDSETALKLIKSDNDRDADLLRADIFWRTRDWVSAGKVFERLIGNAGRDGRRINDLSAALILNWVVALSMSEQVDALNKVRQIYSTQMDMTEYRDAFRLITNKTEGDMQDFRTLTERFKEIGRFQAFLTSYREKLKTKLLSEMN